MSLVTKEPSETQFLLPQHCEHKQESTSTKLRVVLDGSAKTTSGSSLTDLLLARPTIQQKIFNILLRFRFFKVALCGDICKMYSCVRVFYPDDFLQCIVWRESSTEKFSVFKLSSCLLGYKGHASTLLRWGGIISYWSKNFFVEISMWMI